MNVVDGQRRRVRWAGCGVLADGEEEAEITHRTQSAVHDISEQKKGYQ